ncbi:hypothetical protein L1049_016080 [Liquidambar formosana]|uniref:Uncharacterized protein n=1 Tax=Liquidambar formosana TaxID=63359 RepID=A0AAP0RYW5_LIQFO
MVEDDHLVRGFTKTSLPIIGSSVTSTNATIPSAAPVLRRCSSDPYNSPGITNDVGAPSNQIPDSVLGSDCFLNPQSPDNTAAKINLNTTTPSPLRRYSSALPPLPPPFRRSVSDLTSSAYQTPLSTPGDSIKEESPNSKDASDETETEEEVSVERVKEGLSIHFLCPCGKGYQVFLSGRDCYYKLM